MTNNTIENKTIKTPIYKKVWFWILAAIIVFAVWPKGSGEPAVTPSEPVQQTTTAAVDDSPATVEPVKEKQPEAVQEVLAVGDTGTVTNYFDVTLKAAEEKTRVTYNSLVETTDEKFIVLELQVKNISTEKLQIDTDMFQLVDADGLAYSMTLDLNYMLNPNTDFIYTDVNPNISKKGFIAFEVPKDAKDLTLMVDAGYNDLFDTSREITFNLDGDK